jgi:hypothetical protein
MHEIKLKLNFYCLKNGPSYYKKCKYEIKWRLYKDLESLMDLRFTQRWLWWLWLPPASCRFLAWLSLRPWRRRQYIRSKRPWTSSELHGITTQMIIHFTLKLLWNRSGCGECLTKKILNCCNGCYHSQSVGNPLSLCLIPKYIEIKI